MKYCVAALLPLFILLTVFSCKPDEDIITRDGSARLEFSTDTIFFDTVFVETTSVTRRLKVYNRNEKAVEISDIKLEKPAGTEFSLIINGRETNFASNLTLRGKDSLLILVKSRINRNPGTTLPFIIENNLLFQTNNNLQKVYVGAYGQNANFLRDTETCNVIWNDELPYVIYGEVLVPENCKLTMLPGTRVYLHHNSYIFVEGTLDVQGTADKKVIIRHDRLDSVYNDVPGQWIGIYLFDASKNNRIKHAEIKNAVYGLNINNANGNKTIIENTVIKNCFSTGLLAVNSKIDATNTLVTNCGEYAVAGVGGGEYNFNFCTFANYNPEYSLPPNQQKYAIAFSDSVVNAGQLAVSQTNLTVRNSIVWSGLRFNAPRNEVLLLTGPNSPVSISYSLLQMKDQRFSGNNNILNQDPKFAQPNENGIAARKISYALKAGSPAIGQANLNQSPGTDLTGANRPQGTGSNPDMGAYETAED